MDDNAHQQLVAIVGADHVVDDPDVIASYTTDWTGRFRGSAAAIVRPGSTDEVAAVVQWCRRHSVALTPMGGNTGLVGGAVPTAGSIVVSLARMADIEAVDVDAGHVVAGAGATLAAVQRAARDAGFRYTIDLAARDSATIGGTVATNAGGLNFVRFGGTRQQLVGIECVLGSGDVISDLGGLGKDNTGYSLTQLLCGSEGTLGIVTKVRVALHPGTSGGATALIGVETVRHAVDLANALRARRVDVESIELMRSDGIDLVCEVTGRGQPFASRPPFVVLVDVASDDEVKELATVIAEVQADEAMTLVTADPGGRRRLWRYREEHTAAIATRGVVHKLDVTLPLAQLAAFVERVPFVVADARQNATVWLFGHLGDGNIHVNISGVQADDHRVDELVLFEVARMGGSISAEHGIGIAKRDYLYLRRSPAEIRAMRAIKMALDPDGVLNPGVLLPSTDGDLSGTTMAT